VLLLLCLLLARYYTLQISDYETYSTASERNRVQLQPLPPKRGLIFDRNGVLLADNRPSYTLSLIVERVQDLDATLAAWPSWSTIEATGPREISRAHVKQRRPYEHVPLRFRLDDEEQARIAVNRHRLPGVCGRCAAAALLSPRRAVCPCPGLCRTYQRAGAASASTPPTTAARFHIGKIGVERYYEDSCTARSATRPSRPTPTAACCGCSSASTRRPGRT
jgi:penicillin-binding protein 2